MFWDVTAAVFTVVQAWLLRPTDNLGTIVAAILAAFVVAAGLWLNLKQWREEAISRRYQEFEARIEKFRTPETRAAIMMIHNYSRNIPYIDEGTPVTWEEIEVALIPALFREYGLEMRLIKIRDCFNDLLAGLTNLHYLLNNKLVDAADVDHLAKELMIRIATDDTRHLRNLRLYIQWRQTGIMKLFERYGHDIRNKKSEDLKSLRHDIEAGRYGECQPSPWGTL